MKRLARWVPVPPWVLLFFALSSCVVSTPAWAVDQIVTWSMPSAVSSIGGRNVWVYAVTITSATDGTASGTVALHGRVLHVNTNPGTAAPTADYDCVLTDADGVDVLGGALGNRHTSTSERAYPVTGTTVIEPRVDGTHTLSCSAMGAEKGTVISIVVEE